MAIQAPSVEEGAATKASNKERVAGEKRNFILSVVLCRFCFVLLYGLSEYVRIVDCCSLLFTVCLRRPHRSNNTNPTGVFTDRTQNCSM